MTVHPSRFRSSTPTNFPLFSLVISGSVLPPPTIVGRCVLSSIYSQAAAAAGAATARALIF